MGRTRVRAAIIFLSAAAFIAAQGAFAATPQEIYRDYADNGRLDGNYTPADLERVLKDAAVQQYGKPGDEGLKPAVEEEEEGAAGGGAAGGGTAGGQAGGPAPVESTGGLPFTGLDLGLIVAGALGLVFLGTALRRVARQRA
ncbi:MAG TPA: hypothetical protein VFR32_10645 [Gaiellaceae bacterium]|nr:hypothetical protein [Gaiellaceae bacterium]